MVTAEQVQIAADNQAVVDCSDIVCLGVTPQVRPAGTALGSVTYSCIVIFKSARQFTYESHEYKDKHSSPSLFDTSERLFRCCLEILMAMFLRAWGFSERVA